MSNTGKVLEQYRTYVIDQVQIDTFLQKLYADTELVEQANTYARKRFAELQTALTGKAETLSNIDLFQYDQANAYWREYFISLLVGGVAAMSQPVIHTHTTIDTE